MFVLAHLSDPHLGPLPRPRLSELAGKRITGFINWQRKRRAIHRSDVLSRIVADLKAQKPDHVAVTGDLVNLSLAAEYRPARAWLASLGRPSEVTVVPGNHDVYARDATQRPLTHWGDYMRGDDGAHEAMFPFVQRRGPLALIGLSSAVPTLPFLATGRLGGDQLRRLAELLGDCQRQGYFRVVLVHHPPRSEPSDRFKRLADGAALCDTLARHGAELVIHGHDHRHAVTKIAGTSISVIGVPSASETPPGEHDAAGYNLFRVDGAAGSWRCELVMRGLPRDGGEIIELKRQVLSGP